MLSIQTNIAALSAQNSLTSTNNSLQTSMARLSSGFRINRAADDAAGLAISEKMQAQIGGLNQAVRNANDGASMIQTAEGALDQVQNMMVRMRNLAVQAASDTNGPTERDDINVEIQQLHDEIQNISLRTTFNGLGLLNGSLTTQQQLTAGGGVAASTVQAGFVPTGATGTAVTNVDVSGANAADTYTFGYAAGVLTLTDHNTSKSQSINLTGQTVGAGSSTTLNFDSLGIKVSVANSTAAAVAMDTAVANGLNAGTITTALADHSAILQTGADASQGNTTSVSMLDTRLDSGASAASMIALNTAISTFNTAAGTNAGPSDGDATGLITAIDTANAWISSQRAALGAAQNRLSYAAASLTTTAQNVTAANSQIRDVDVASETSNMSKDQILMQAGVSVLAQANQVQQLALKLLG